MKNTLSVKWFNQPVLLKNTQENRDALENIGYKPDKGNKLSHVNIVTSAETYFTISEDRKDLKDFLFPIWRDTIDCRNNSKKGLNLATKTQIEIKEL